MVFLDSDILIDFLRNDSKTIQKIKELSTRESLSITSINSFEIFKGLRNSKLNSQNIGEFLSNFNVIGFDFLASKKAAEIFNELKSKGEILELPDVMIASIVISNNDTLITGNVDHFNRIKELKIENLRDN